MAIWLEDTFCAWSNKLCTEVVSIGPGIAPSYDLAAKSYALCGMSVTRGRVPSPTTARYT
jgi:hypothetical protein